MNANQKIPIRHPPNALLPSDGDSEQALIGALIDDPRKLFDVRSLLDEGDVFYYPDMADYYAAILAVCDAGADIRPLTIIQHLRKVGKERLLSDYPPQQLQNQGIGVNGLQTALHLRELYIQRLAYTQASVLIQSVLSHEPLDAQIELSRSLGDMIAGKMTVVKEKPIAHYVKKALSQIVDASTAEAGLVGVQTGSGKINRLTGGWRPKKYIVLAARPGGGKTAVMLCHAKAAAADKSPVAIVSGEMPNEELILRLIASECQISYDELGKGRYEDGTPFSPADWTRIHQAGGYIESLPIHFYPGEIYDIANVIYWLLDMLRRHQIGSAWLDYVQLFEDRSLPRNATTTDKVASVSRKLRLFCSTAEIPVIALAQLGRQVDQRDNRRPQLIDLKESGQLEQDADIVIGLYRDDYYKLEKAKKEAVGGKVIPPDYDQILEYDFLKFRGGKPRMVKMWIDIGTNRWADNDPTPALPPVPQKEKAADKWVQTFPQSAVGHSFYETDRPDDNLDTPF